MVYYSAKVEIYRRVAELAGHPLHDGPGVVAMFQFSMEARAAVIYALIPERRQQGNFPTIEFSKRFQERL